MEREFEIPILPKNSQVHWFNVFQDWTDHLCDEDMVYITLENGKHIDAGQYGDKQPYFRVVAVDGFEGWNVIESIECQDTDEVIDAIIKLAFKYN